jgi:hypothetical protein
LSVAGAQLQLEWFANPKQNPGVAEQRSPQVCAIAFERYQEETNHV